MEALTAVQVALLTIYDMCKAVDWGMTIKGVKLLEKYAGKIGSFVAGPLELKTDTPKRSGLHAVWFEKRFQPSPPAISLAIQSFV